MNKKIIILIITLLIIIIPNKIKAYELETERRKCNIQWTNKSI